MKYTGKLFNDELGSHSSRMQMGVHTNVALTDISDEGGIVTISFEAPDGTKISKKLWEPKGSYPISNEFVQETVAEAIEREKKLNGTHVTAILNILIGVDESNKLESNSYEDWMFRAVTLIKAKMNLKKFNVKVTIDTKGFTNLGKYANYLEEHVPGQESKLFITAKDLEMAAKGGKVTSERRLNTKPDNLPF